MHGVGSMIGDVASDQVCGAFVICDPLSVEPSSFDFAFVDMKHDKLDEQQNRIRVEVDVSKQMTVVYEGVANTVKHSLTGAVDEILCDKGLCLRSSNSRR